MYTHKRISQYDIELRCPICRTVKHIRIPASDVDGYDAWSRRQISIQDAFPNMSASDREMLISGTCPECWDQIFVPQDQDEDPERWDGLS